MKYIKNSFVLSLLFMISVSALVLWICLSLMTIYTKHGKEQIVPNLEGKSIHYAEHVLDSLGFKVEIDSSFRLGYAPGVVIKQFPGGNRKSKYGRSILLHYNKYETPNVLLPSFTNMTLRSAYLMMRSMNLVPGDTIFRHDITKGIILEQYVNGQLAPPGTAVPVGTRISFVVSSGLGEPNIPMQLLIGKTYQEAMAFFTINQLTPQIVWIGTFTDTANAKIITQMPMHINNYGQRNYVAMGEYIDIQVMQNPSDSLIKENSYVKIIPLPYEYSEDSEDGIIEDNTTIDLNDSDPNSEIDKENTTGTIPTPPTEKGSGESKDFGPIGPNLPKSEKESAPKPKAVLPKK